MAPRNGGQEFGELKGAVEGLSSSLADFRQETRAALSEMKREFLTALKEHAEKDERAWARVSKLESARVFMVGRITGIVGTVTLAGGVIWGLSQLAISIFKR